ncbi:Zinc-regulated TonB-dependent outer membrane receptor [hydrothermal vent metagenome]|uniref:Zinc-regulated TonB-dependent outer membrane receptor n=1 Tax=hydrothermal vent metagenome TaxID=652676 RepID=A0A1W1C4C6_9ZZZZ
MTKKIILLSLAASVSLFAQSELEEVKALLEQQIKTTQALQKRVAELEKKQQHTVTHAARKSKTLKHHKHQVSKPKPIKEEDTYTTAENTMPSEQHTQTFDQKSFLPDIALILNGSAVGRNVNNSTYETQYIPGFSTYNAANPNEIPFNKDRGFNFNYAEISMHSTVGPYFDADAIFHLHPDEFEIEEAYITSRNMPYGLRAKAGKFRSEFGRINAIHQHAWKFTSQPLVFNALFGPEGINDAGVQLQWVLPTETYVMAGIEAMQGSNDVSFGDTEKNNLYIGYLKSSFDISDTSTLLAGASILHGKNEQGLNTDVYGADLTALIALSSYSSLTWQSELLYRNADNQEDQAGYYTQLTYKYNQNWQGGVRYDSLYKNRDSQPDDLDRFSAVLQYSPFEFTKFRLEYSYDRSKAFGDLADQRKNISQILLDFTIEAGAHGAHAF